MPEATKRLSDEELQELRARYQELVGFVPPRAGARIELLAELDPETLRMQEEIRRRLMYPACFDVKTAQLMLFGMLLMPLADAARLHAAAARRAGASWEEMNAVVGLAYLFRGLPAANLGALILKEIRDEERRHA
ncbi:carboxymuconolactone decarboxylase family protein [Limnochorda pilosa]|uniref:Carboxymuconolactone decarboxylase n=1 Tax=Limnochorda pilosa TaxID=1555112 RepID=A0A0K2SLM7_LIMPI|nr:carboxymuconolactone decarboxylase family protein [Limnochorda pilosa]BAS28010.1 carboxymuconolactone decarboxylase [Limnochorda pilosa]